METCRRCSSDLEEDEGVRCLRKQTSDGSCPVADFAPDLEDQNDQAVDIFHDLLRTAKQVHTDKDTTEFYCMANEFHAVCQVRGVEEEDQELTWKKVLLLESVWNENRPKDKKPSKKK